MHALLNVTCMRFSSLYYSVDANRRQRQTKKSLPKEALLSVRRLSAVDDGEGLLGFGSRVSDNATNEKAVVEELKVV